ncbi:MAG: hypothetical protein ABI954_12270 [Pyrinomonadaceae bacterium]
MTVYNSAMDFLLAKLDAEDRERAGEKYLVLLDELANFLRLKNSSDSQTAAEEALDRTAKKIAAGADVLHIRAYAFRVAKFVLLEQRRKLQPDALPENYENRFAAPEIKSDLRLECLEECLNALGFIDREIIVNYYEGEGRSKADLKIKLAERFGLTMTALKLRALRARQKLEKCINNCLAKK